jgi:hypothetical protein
VAAGDVNGDGRADIIAGKMAGSQAEIRVFDGYTHFNIGAPIFPFGSFTGGLSVGAGDVDGDGKSDIFAGAGPGGGPHVRVLRGPNFSDELSSFFAYDLTFTGGVRVAGGDADGDGLAEVITGAGTGGGPHVRVFNPHTTAVLRELFAYEITFFGGIFVDDEGFNSRSSTRTVDDADAVLTGAWASTPGFGECRNEANRGANVAQKPK